MVLSSLQSSVWVVELYFIKWVTTVSGMFSSQERSGGLGHSRGTDFLFCASPRFGSVDWTCLSRSLGERRVSEGERGWARPRGCVRFPFPSDTPHPLPSPSVRESHQELLFYTANIHLLLPIYLCLHSFYFFELFVIEFLHPEKYFFCILISMLLLVVSYLMFI